MSTHSVREVTTALVGSPPVSPVGAAAGPVVILMGYDMFRGSRDKQVEVSTAERGLAALIEVAERAVEKIGSSLPPPQLRPLPIIPRARRLNLNRRATPVGALPAAPS